ncbi:MAG: 2-amino-4-hydroxy-6-hydroxymethyldihydropteridine diphosphokinase [Micavibrio sp.]|nr:2-amino-4-hydroxy-6-hydroxymethyldihydropteridine diphosphokinase [Micavibrio sp.]
MIFIALGANLQSLVGAPEATFKAALAALEEAGVRVVAFSSVWESPPWPEGSDQPWYENAVAIVETALPVELLLRLMHEVEAEFGRDRAGEARNAARTLDLDLIAYNDVVMDDGLVLPHPRMHERSFVLYPLCEIAPDWGHPLFGRSVREMCECLPDSLIIRLKHKKVA